MKYVRMLGLAAVAAAALMAFVGASTASATVFCDTEGTAGPGQPIGTTCPEGWQWKLGTEIHAVNEGTATLTTEFKNIECKKSTVSGKTSNQGSATETVNGSIEVLTFEECNCTVTVLKKGTLEVHWISGTQNGTLTSSGAEITATCSTIFGNVHCIYSTSATDLGTLTGGKPAKMDISSADIPRLTTSSLCDKTANWDATYSITSPATFYVTGHI